MSKYGSGLTFGTVCNMEKDEIKHALDGEVLDFYDDYENSVYRKGTKEEIREVVLSAYDEVVYNALQVMASSRAISNLYEKKLGMPNMLEYNEQIMEELNKFNDYIYESNDEDAL